MNALVGSVRAARLGIVAPRVDGMVYDWDLWPGRVAAGSSETDWYIWRMGGDVTRVAIALGMSFTAALEGVTAVMRDFGKTAASVGSAFRRFVYEIDYADCYGNPAAALRIIEERWPR